MCSPRPLAYSGFGSCKKGISCQLRGTGERLLRLGAGPREVVLAQAIEQHIRRRPGNRRCVRIGDTRIIETHPSLLIPIVSIVRIHVRDVVSAVERAVVVGDAHEVVHGREVAQIVALLPEHRRIGCSGGGSTTTATAGTSGCASRRGGLVVVVGG